MPVDPSKPEEEVIDAEIVETSTNASWTVAPIAPDSLAPDSLAQGSLAPDYSDSGVPSLDYVRDRIQGRFATATGSAELATAAAARQAASKEAGDQQAALAAEQRRQVRERAAKDRLDEIRRSLRSDG